MRGPSGCTREHPLQIPRLLSAIASEATGPGWRVRLDSTQDRVAVLEQEKSHGKAGCIARPLRMHRVIVGGQGCLPLSQSGKAPRFHLLSKPHGHASLMIRNKLDIAE